jgi:signal recognition particle GTPase
MAEENISKKGLPISIVNKLCKMTTSGENRENCDKEYEKVLLGETDINEFIDNIEKTTEEEQAKELIRKVRKWLREQPEEGHS